MLVYIADIVVQFLTSYLQVQTGDEVTKPRMIAGRYIRGEFSIDLLSTFPFRYFRVKSQVYNTITKICSLLKVLRIRKLYSTISQANLTEETKALYKIGFCSFLLFVYTHIISCVIWWFFKTDYLWVAPTDFGMLRSRMNDPWYTTSYSTDA